LPEISTNQGSGGDLFLTKVVASQSNSEIGFSQEWRQNKVVFDGYSPRSRRGR